MKNATRLEDIDGFLRDGGSIEELIIECEPSQKARNWSKVGMEIDMGDYVPAERRKGKWYTKE